MELVCNLGSSWIHGSGRGSSSHGWEGFCIDLVYQLHPFLAQRTLLVVTHTLVTSYLDSCNVLRMGLPLKLTQKLQLVWNVTMQVVGGLFQYM